MVTFRQSYYKISVFDKIRAQKVAFPCPFGVFTVLWARKRAFLCPKWSEMTKRARKPMFLCPFLSSAGLARASITSRHQTTRGGRVFAQQIRQGRERWSGESRYISGIRRCSLSSSHQSILRRIRCELFSHREDRQ